MPELCSDAALAKQSEAEIMFAKIRAGVPAQQATGVLENKIIQPNATRYVTEKAGWCYDGSKMSY